MSRAFASWGAALLDVRQGDVASAVSMLEPVVAWFRGADRPAWFPLLAAVLGEAYTLSGRIDDGQLLLTEALEQTTRNEVVVNRSLCALTLAAAQFAAGLVTQGHELAERALSLAQAHHELGNEAYALLILGEISIRLPAANRTPADVHIANALRLADSLGMRPLQAHCHRVLGALYAQTDRRKHAIHELSAAIQMYRTMAMTFWRPESRRC